MTHPTKPAAGAPEAVLSSPVEDDTDRARLLHLALGGSFYTDHNVEAIAAEFARIRAEEREACAVLVETWAQDHLTTQPSFTRIAAAIRSRGEGDANEKG